MALWTVRKLPPEHAAAGISCRIGRRQVPQPDGSVRVEYCGEPVVAEIHRVDLPPGVEPYWHEPCRKHHDRIVVRGDYGPHVLYGHPDAPDGAADLEPLPEVPAEDEEVPGHVVWDAPTKDS
jgi:hypothetical protein